MKYFGSALIGLLLIGLGQGQEPSQTPNYDESKVPPYTLPDPLILSDGKPVSEVSTWFEKRRPEILKLFETNVYGKSPDPPRELPFKVTDRDRNALGGLATRKLVRVGLTRREEGPSLDLLLYLPNQVTGPVPVFLALNFMGNQSISSDPGVPVTESWLRNNEALGISDHRATEATRGAGAGKWPLELILKSGFGVATAYYGDIDPDYDDEYKEGIHRYYFLMGQRKPASDQWGSIGAWAYGLRRAMDYLEKDNDVARRRVILMGHSRLGKTALWAGALDQRFAMVISNDSGCGGAALSRRRFGETVESINRDFPHWFCDNFKQYSGREDQLPVDQHMLLALIAPRPLYVASAAEDLWADPRGEFLSARAADPVYRLLQAGGLDAQEMPPVDQPVIGTMGYHVRSGGHDVTNFDWEQFIKFARLNLERRNR